MQFLQENDIQYHVCLDKQIDIPGVNGVTCDNYAVGAITMIPAIVLIDKKGNIVTRKRSLSGGDSISIQDIEKEILKLIDEN